jgi:hypothetical protein
MLGPHIDPDAGTPFDGPELEPAILEIEARTEQVGGVFGEGYPHRLREIAGATTEIVIARHHTAPAAHDLEPIDRRQGANQHRRRRSFRLRDNVHHPVNAVVEIHVGVAGLAVHWRVPARRPGRRVAGRIALADIRLDFDDGAAGSNATPLVNEHFTQQIARDVEGGTVVEGSR